MFAIKRDDLELLFNSFFKIVNATHAVVIPRMSYDKLTENAQEILGINDYVRWRALKLMAELIEARNLEGAVAEAGVWRGGFSYFINLFFPKRKFYLFDTFTGFDKEQIKEEVANQKIDSFFQDQQTFDSTSIEFVYNKMPHKENCIFCKGLFEQTSPLVDEKNFVFVSLDMDLFKPMLTALEYFWPKMQVGGAIFMHDFNHSKIHGIRDVVQEFEKRHGFIPKMPLPDEGGSIVLLKN